MYASSLVRLLSDMLHIPAKNHEYDTAVSNNQTRALAYLHCIACMHTMQSRLARLAYSWHSLLVLLHEVGRYDVTLLILLRRVFVTEPHGLEERRKERRSLRDRFVGRWLKNRVSLLQRSVNGVGDDSDHRGAGLPRCTVDDSACDRLRGIVTQCYTAINDVHKTWIHDMQLSYARGRMP
jgi:hypothetical protein